MALIDSMILTACMGMSGQSNDACQKALTAGSKQSGVEQNLNLYESNQTKNLELKAYSWFGKEAVGVVGGAVWLGKSVSEKKASFGLYGPVSMDVGQKLTRLVLKWTF